MIRTAAVPLAAVLVMISAACGGGTTAPQSTSACVSASVPQQPVRLPG